MPQLSRLQLLVYGALGVAVLLIGARWIQSGQPGEGGHSFDFTSAEGVASGGAPVQQGSTEAHAFSVEGQSGDVVVHVAGAVGDPGVYRLPAGSRVTDAVERAGGPTANAAVDALNLAARLADGQQIVLPSSAKSAAGVAVGSATGATSAATGAADPEVPISLGGATLEQLDTIEGIGPVTAQNIIAFRDEQGGLSSIEQLDEVSGIGPSTMEALRSRLQP